MRDDANDLTDPLSPNQLGDQVRAAVGRLYRRFRNERPVGDLGDAAFDVLAYLHKSGPQTLTALSERAGVTPASMSQSINRLAAADYIRRVPDAGDRRKVWIEPTEVGAELAGTTRAIRNAWLEARLEGLAEEDRAVLARACALLLAIADDRRR